MVRLAVQEVVSTGQVMEVAVPVQDFRVIKPDTSIKGTKATREVTTIRGTGSSSSRVTGAIPSS